MDDNFVMVEYYIDGYCWCGRRGMTAKILFEHHEDKPPVEIGVKYLCDRHNGMNGCVDYGTPVPS